MQGNLLIHCIKTLVCSKFFLCRKFTRAFDCWLVVLGFNATLTAKVISWRSVTHVCFPGFLTPVLTQLFFPKPPTTFFTFFCRGERRKCAGKKSRLNRGSNSQPPGHESDSLTTEPPERDSQAEIRVKLNSESFREREREFFKACLLGLDLVKFRISTKTPICRDFGTIPFIG